MNVEQLTATIAQYIYAPIVYQGVKYQNFGIRNHPAYVDGDSLEIFVEDKIIEWDEDCKLLLRPIKDMYDEELAIACKVLKISLLSVEAMRVLVARNLEQKTLLTVCPGSYIPFITYLLSIGIDLPCYYLGGKTLLEAGIAVYDTELNNLSTDEQ